MCGSMVDIQSAAAEIRRGKKRKIDRKKPQGKNIMACPIPLGGPNNANRKPKSEHMNVNKVCSVNFYTRKMIRY